MALMRAIARVDEDGKIAIPKNIRREANLEPGASVEIKLGGPMLAQFVTIRKRGSRQRPIKAASIPSNAPAS